MLYTGDYKEHPMITWHINARCNFRCDYCDELFRDRIYPSVDLRKLDQGLETLGEDWVILLTGGEPFLEPNFVELCQTITRKHLLAINTNLSLDNAFAFGEELDPSRVLFINAALHITEREKIDPDLSAFVNKMKFLQDRGFHVLVYYIAHPENLGRMKDDMKLLEDKGIEKIRMKIFRGIYRKKFYPIAFTEEEDAFIASFEKYTDWPELALLGDLPGFKGKRCNTGQRFFYMNREGDLRRCSGVFTRHGNLLESRIRFDEEPRPCPAKYCAALYEGIRNARDEEGKVPFLEGLRLGKRAHQIENVLKNPHRALKLREKYIRHCALT